MQMCSTYWEHFELWSSRAGCSGRFADLNALVVGSRGDRVGGKHRWPKSTNSALRLNRDGPPLAGERWWDAEQCTGIELHTKSGLYGHP